MTESRALFAVLLSWLSAQAMKMALAKAQHGRLFGGRVMRTGGMPSAHATLVSSLAFCAASYKGWGSVEFLITIVFALIVCYDALGMRREFHKQSRLLRELAARQLGEEKVREEYPGIGEFRGHEVAEIAAGLALGVAVSALVLELWYK